MPVDDRSRRDARGVTLDGMPEKTPFAPLIRTQSDLQRAWQALMGPWRYSGMAVWMMVVLDDRPVPHLTEITECDEPPEDAGEALAQLLGSLADDLGPQARFAFLRSRPGTDVITETDRAWARSLYDAARRARVPCEVVHLGTRGSVRPITADDVGIGRPA
jgi:hypothetical protein